MRLEKDPKVISGGHRRANFLVAIPTLGMVPIEWALTMLRLQWPMNCHKESLMVKGLEVGVARNSIAEEALKINPGPEYILFLGDDVLVSWNSFMILWDEMKKGSYDVLAGLYYIKGDKYSPPMPILFRDDYEGFMTPGKDFKVGDIVHADIVGMDFTLIRTSIFKDLGDPPWFKTADLDDMYDPVKHSLSVFTEDVFFCKKVKAAGLRIGCHTNCKISHYNIQSGECW